MKFCVLTGGSLGLGKGLLSLLEKDQWFVCEISRSGNSRHGIPFDLARTGEIDDLIRRVSNVSPEDLLAPRDVAGAIMAWSETTGSPISGSTPSRTWGRSCAMLPC